MTEHLVARILCVDDEVEVLYALKRLLRSSDFIVDLSADPEQALELIINNQYDLIISDMRMPKMDGAELLAAAEKYSPSTRRVLLTGYSDQEATARAINQGKIHAYIEKPWDNRAISARIMSLLHAKMQEDKRAQEIDELKQSYESVRQRKLSLNDQVRRSNRQLEKTVAFLNVEHGELQHNVKALVKILASLSVVHCDLDADFLVNFIKRVSRFADRLYMNDSQKQCLIQAAQLCQIGKLLLPKDFVNIPQAELSDKGLRAFKSYPRLSYDSLLPIEALHESNAIVLAHQEHFDGSGYPNGLFDHGIPLGSRLLKIVLDYSLAVATNGPGRGLAHDQVVKEMSDPDAYVYDRDLLEVFLDLAAEPMQLQGRTVRVDELAEGDVICEDLYDKAGGLLQVSGTRCTLQSIQKLAEYESLNQRALTVMVE